MANVVGRTDRTTGKAFNVQNTKAVTSDGAAQVAAKVVGEPSPKSYHYEPSDFEFPSGKKAFPMRPQHFFTCTQQAKQVLDWNSQHGGVEAILRDAYENDFVLDKTTGGLKGDFECDDMVTGSSIIYPL